MLALLPEWLVLTYVGVVGALVGSFLNVVIARLPAGESIVHPRSRCPRCKTQIAWYDNIPLVSWLVLRARCRRCGMPIPVRYPLVELLGCALFLATYARLGPSWSLALWLPLVAALLAIVFLDLDHWWVPDVITFPAMVWAFACAWLPDGIGPVTSLLGALPALGLWAFAWGFERFTGREGMGLGDVKLLAVVGLALGPLGAVLALFLASLQGSVAGVVVVLSGGHKGVDQRRAVDDEQDASDGERATAASESATTVASGRPPEPAEASQPAPGSEEASDEDDWTPHPRSVPFGPFLVLGCYELLLMPGIFRELPLQWMGLDR